MIEMKKFAFLIGISNYYNPDIVSLPAADEETKILSEILKDTREFDENSIKLLISSSKDSSKLPTMTTIYREFLLFLNYIKKFEDEDDIELIISFNGHGGNLNGKDLVIAMDGAKFPELEKKYPDFYQTSMGMIDITFFTTTLQNAGCNDGWYVFLLLNACRENLSIVLGADNSTMGFQDDYGINVISCCEYNNFGHIFNDSGGQHTVFGKALNTLLKRTLPKEILYSDFKAQLENAVTRLASQYNKTQNIKCQGVNADDIVILGTVSANQKVNMFDLYNLYKFIQFGRIDEIRLLLSNWIEKESDNQLFIKLLAEFNDNARFLYPVTIFDEITMEIFQIFLGTGYLEKYTPQKMFWSLNKNNQIFQKYGKTQIFDKLSILAINGIIKENPKKIHQYKLSTHNKEIQIREAKLLLEFFNCYPYPENILEKGDKILEYHLTHTNMIGSENGLITLKIENKERKKWGLDEKTQFSNSSELIKMLIVPDDDNLKNKLLNYKENEPEIIPFYNIYKDLIQKIKIDDFFGLTSLLANLDSTTRNNILGKLEYIIEPHTSYDMELVGRKYHLYLSKTPNKSYYRDVDSSENYREDKKENIIVKNQLLSSIKARLSLDGSLNIDI